MSSNKDKMVIVLVFETPAEGYDNGGFQEEGKNVKRDEN